MASLYAITLVGASAAAMSAAFMGGNMHPVGETGPQENVKTLEPEPEPEPEADPEPEPEPVQQPKAVQQPELEPEPGSEPVQQPEVDPVEMAGGAMGRPNWAPSLDAVPPKSFGAILATVTQAIPTNTAAIQAELNKVTVDWENVSYEKYDAESRKKDILSQLDGGTGSDGTFYAGIRQQYRTASVGINVGKIQIDSLNKKLQSGTNPAQTGEKGVDIIKRILGADQLRLPGEDVKARNIRLIKAVKESEDPELVSLRFDRSTDGKGGDSTKQNESWWNRMQQTKASGTSVNIDTLVTQLTALETKVGNYEDTAANLKEDYDRLTKELTDVRTEIAEKAVNQRTLNERRLALINALSQTDKTITSASSAFRPVSDAQLKDILVRYNKALLDLEDKKRTFKTWYIQNYMNKTPAEQAKVKADLDRLTADINNSQAEVDKLRINLAGESTREGTPLDKIIFQLKKNAVSGTQVLTDLVPIFDIYYEISKKLKAQEIIDELARYNTFFKSGFDGQIVDRGFGYLFELSKRSEGTDYDSLLKTFIEENRDIVYNAYANLKITEGVLNDTRADPTSSMKTSDAVRGLLEGKSKIAIGLSKVSHTFAWKTTDKDKISKLVENFGRRIVDRLDSVNIGRNWRGVKIDEISIASKESVTDKLEELQLLLSSKFGEFESLSGSDMDKLANKDRLDSLLAEIRIICTRVLLLIDTTDPAYTSLTDFLKIGFTGGAKTKIAKPAKIRPRVRPVPAAVPPPVVPAVPPPAVPASVPASVPAPVPAPVPAVPLAPDDSKYIAKINSAIEKINNIKPELVKERSPVSNFNKILIKLINSLVNKNIELDAKMRELIKTVEDHYKEIRESDIESRDREDFMIILKEIDGLATEMYTNMTNLRNAIITNSNSVNKSESDILLEKVDGYFRYIDTIRAWIAAYFFSLKDPFKEPPTAPSFDLPKTLESLVTKLKAFIAKTDIKNFIINFLGKLTSLFPARSSSSVSTESVEVPAPVLKIEDVELESEAAGVGLKPEAAAEAAPPASRLIEKQTILRQIRLDLQNYIMNPETRTNPFSTNYGILKEFSERLDGVSHDDLTPEDGLILLKEKTELRTRIQAQRNLLRPKGGNHTTRRQWVRSKPSRFTRHRMY